MLDYIRYIPIIFFFAGFPFIWLVVYAWNKRSAPAVIPFIWTMLGTSIWTFGYSLEIFFPKLAEKLFFINIEYIGIVSIPVTIFFFTMEYTGRKPGFIRSIRYIIWFVPALVLLLVWTNPYHHLMWDMETVTEIYGLRLLETRFGPFFWVNIIYSYLLLTISAIILAIELFHTEGIHRTQILLVFVGVASPVLLNIFYINNSSIVPGLDWTPLAFLSTAITFHLAIMKYNLLDIMPTAYLSILNNMKEGVIVLDKKDRVKYVNPAITKLFDQPAASILGRSLDQISPPFAQSVQPFLTGKDHQGDVKIGPPNNEQVFHIYVSFLESRDGSGSMITLHNITEKKWMEIALRRRQDTLDLLQKLTRLSLQAHDITEMGEQAVGLLRELIKADGCFITLWNNDKNQAMLLSAYGLDDASIGKLNTMPEDFPLTKSVLETGKPLVVKDLAASPFANSLTTLFPFTSVVTLPLIVLDKKLGAMIFAFTEYHQFTAVENAICSQAADLLALAILKFQALEQAYKQVKTSEMLRRAGTSISKNLIMDATISDILEQLLHVVPYTSATVQLLEGDELRIVGGHGWDDINDVLGLRYKVPSDNPNTIVLKTGKPYQLPETWKQFEQFRKPPHDHILSWLGVPLIHQNKIIGILAIDSSEPNHFKEADAQIATEFAGQVAIALENARLFQEIQQQAITDPLTGLYNRRGLYEFGKNEFARALHHNTPFSAILLDLDHFKNINDTYGHPIGDIILIEFAKMCKNCIRDFDLLGRFGGEEVVILLPETNKNTTFKIAERLRSTIENSPIYVNDNLQLNMTASLGVATKDEHITSLDTLIARADQAMYIAKFRGRNQIAESK